MHIADVSSLKDWLQEKLKSICQADPLSLSRYVIALVKKDKPEEELVKACLDQLEVFLQENTNQFVNTLFETIRKESYIPQSTQQIQGKGISSPKQHDVGRRPKSRSRSRSPTLNPRRVASSLVTTSQQPPFTKQSKCRDFEERGFCTKGDTCPFEHGADALVVDNQQLPDFVSVPVPLMPITAVNSTVPAYRPTPIDQHSVFSLSRGAKSNIVTIPLANATTPDSFPSVEKLSGMSEMPLQPHMEVHPCYSRGTGGRGRGRGGRGRGSWNPESGSSNWVPRGNRCCAVLVRKVPVHMNNVGKLNDHFQKFGTVVNIKIGFENQPDAALVEFSSWHEATAAFRSPEPILSNRFIRLRLYDTGSQGGPPPTLPCSMQQPHSVSSVSPPVPVFVGGGSNVNDARFVGRLGGEKNGGEEESKKKETIPALFDGDVNNDEVDTETPANKILDPSNGNHEEAFQERKRQKHEEALQLRQKQLQEFEKVKQAKAALVQRAELVERYRRELKTLLDRHASSSDPTEKRQLQDTIKEMNAKMVEIEGKLSNVTPLDQIRVRIKSLTGDIRTKKASGEDVSELLKKLADLKRQLHTLETAQATGITTVKHQQGPESKSKSLQSTLKFRETTKLDKRSTCVYIVGHAATESDDLYKLLINSKFVLDKFEKHDIGEDGVAVVTFSSRKQAELAVHAVTKFRNNSLTLSFTKPAILEKTSEEDQKLSLYNKKPINPTNVDTLDDEPDSPLDEEDRGWRH